MPFREKISYHFFKKRLRLKMNELYQMEDPWGGAYLSEVFAPFLRTQMEALPGTLKPVSVLDAGGGEGHFYPPLKDLIGAYTLLDINQTALSRAKKNLSGTTGARFMGKALDEFRPRPGEFGCIWLVSILNFLGAGKHPKTVKDILARLWKGLADKGRIIMIHPFYEEKEAADLKVFLRELETLGASSVYEESRAVGRQQFFLGAAQKN